MGPRGIKSFMLETIPFGYFLLALRLLLKFRFSHIWHEAVPSLLPKHCSAWQQASGWNIAIQLWVRWLSPEVNYFILHKTRQQNGDVLGLNCSIEWTVSWRFSWDWSQARALCLEGRAGDLLSILAQSAGVIRVKLARHSTSHQAS